MSMPIPRASFALTTVALMLAGPAVAASFKLDDGIDGSFDTQITAGVGIRTGNATCILVGDPTACGGSANTAQGSASDNGDLNYKAGQAFTGYLKATNELLLHKPDVGLDFMARATYFYDPAADSTDRTKLYGGEAQVVYNFQLLDLWAGKKFSIGDRDWRVRVGNQVINWGESYFFFGGINATNAIDFQKSLIPGAQIKEYVLPSPIVSLAGEVADGVNVEGYYQFGWVPNRYPAANSYWSAADFIGRGNTDILTLNTSNFNELGLDAASILRLQGVRGLVSRGQLSAVESQILAPGGAYGVVGAPILTSRDPYSDSNQFANQGQFGLSAHYKPSGSTIDLGLYYLHYFDHSPVLSYVGNPNVSGGVDAQARYLANRDLIGASTNFPLGPWAIGSELSYRPHDAVSLSGCFTPGQPIDANVNLNPVPSGDCPLWKDMQKYEAHLVGQLNLTPSDNPTVIHALRADTAVLTFELVGTEYPGLTKTMTQTVEGVTVEQLPAAGYITWLNGKGLPKAVGSAFSSGLAVDFNWTYDGSLLPGWQVTPDITYYAALTGETPTLSANYMSGAQSLNLAVYFNQNPAVWQAGVNFTLFFGGAQPYYQPYRDRSFVGLFLTRNL